MRVITGTARGRRLKSFKGDDIRPTSDAVKEAIFSAIQFEIGGAVVADLFAGTGQLGAEALSRGAERVYFTDSAPESVKIIRENIALCGFADKAEVSPLSVAAFLKKTAASFDIALLDPPYGQDLINRTLPALVPKMNAGGLIICEHEREYQPVESCENYTVRKTYKHGKKSVTIYGET
jgi:16S rRNA (guanine(966)-N(2))-methyltransferase RsmD